MGRKFLIAIGLFVTVGTLVSFLPRPKPVPAVATEAQLIAFLDAERARIVATAIPQANDPPGPVIELPARERIRFLTAAPAADWFACGGRFSPEGVLTLPNAERPFLFPADVRGGSKPARFVLVSPPMRGIAPVRNAQDLPPVLLTRGQDRTVWTGRLGTSGKRYLLPDRDGCRGLAIADDGFPAPRTGEIAPRDLAASDLPRTGVLLGVTTLFRKRMRESAVSAPVFTIGRRGVVTARSVHYEARTLVHQYRRAGTRWRYAATRVVVTTAYAQEGSDAAALARMGLSPLPKAFGPGFNAPLHLARVPGSTLAPYREATP